MRYAISIAGNIDPQRWMPEALRMLQEQFVVTTVSDFYLTPAIDRPEQDDYWNGGCVVETQMTTPMVRQLLRGIEDACGRVREDDRFAARTLDLDILLGPDGLDADVEARPFLQQILSDLGAASEAEHALGHPLQLPSALPVAWRPVANP